MIVARARQTVRTSL